MWLVPGLPPETRLFMCHDYKAPGRDEFCWETTVAAELENVHLAGGVTEEAFVAMRESRDATLFTPKLCCPQSRSTSVADDSRRPGRTGSAICVFRCNLPDFPDRP